MWLLINNIHENITTTTNFDSARIFSSLSWLAETDYYLCQIQTFSKSNCFKIIQLKTWKCARIDLCGHQPVKDNSVYNNQQK